MLPLSIKDDEYKPAKFNLLFKMSGWFRSILSDKTSRNLFFFLCLNLSFAFVELLYGIWSNSLGLISDSFHMFFDCTALLAGLAASVISRWRSNDAFSYGYVRAEVLAGFVNGLFLIFTAFFIFSEGVEVCCVSKANAMYQPIWARLFCFQTDEPCSPPAKGPNKQILQGIFLHIVADTLGSVGVIISALLMQNYDLMIADPICSMIISLLIGVSVVPLLRESIGILMQRTPPSLDHVLPECYQRVQQLQGVYNLQEPHFWTLCTDVNIGTLKLLVAPDADSRWILSQTHNIFTQAGVRQLYVQIDVAAM
ncbi:zinc transporter 7 [Polyodon spathula]|uniref:zinc transporter 7 n=1 Tax=Polyodon spathula TaxID=7913 RepID=UPI001B7E8467|nr:zinc transporter 7 [Polyodon spathula]